MERCSSPYEILEIVVELTVLMRARNDKDSKLELTLERGQKPLVVSYSDFFGSPLRM